MNTEIIVQINASFIINMFIVLYLILLILMSVILTIMQRAYGIKRSHGPLSDKFQSFFKVFTVPIENILANIADWMVYVLIAVTIYCTFKYDYDMKIINGYLKTHIALLYVRLFIVYATDVPACMSLNRPSHFLDGTTIDTMFSGHTLVTYMLTAYIDKFIHLGPLRYIIVLIEAMILVGAKMHYTMDVVVAATIGYFAFR
jgi:hypothetical protein